MKKILIITTLCLLASPALAQETPKPTEYQLLAPIPEVTISEGSASSTAQSYLEGIFKLIISLAGVSAVVMIMYGGFTYMFTDAFEGKSEAKSIIQNAIWGLALAMGAWLILNTIDTSLVNLNLSLERQKIEGDLGSGSGGTTPVNPLTEEERADHNRILKILKDMGIEPSIGRTCETTNVGCVNLNGLKQQTVDGLRSLTSYCKKPCGTILISGGTEGGHTTNSMHHQGLAVDILPNAFLNALITGGINGSSPQECKKYTNPNFKGTFLWEPRGSTCGGNVPSSGDHWHVSY